MGIKQLKKYKIAILGLLVIAFAVICVLAYPLRNYSRWALARITGGATVAERVEQYRDAVKLRLAPDFENAGIAFPAEHIVLVGIKDTRKLELWARSGQSDFALIKTYPILAASGKPGPKLREGDLQVPEGVYGINLLHPNSMFHLSLRIDYPNSFDREMAAIDGRENLGGNIMIHGSDRSVGCIAIGDEAIEEIFVLAAIARLEHVKVIIMPTDLRLENNLNNSMLQPASTKWRNELYLNIREAITETLPQP